VRLTALGYRTQIVELTVSGDADQVEARLREALDAHGLQLVARTDHAAGARKADVELEPDVLLIFGNACFGTALMQTDPRVGIELPLRMLVWQDPTGRTSATSTPRELTDRYALDGHQQMLERQTAVLTKVAAAAAGLSTWPPDRESSLRLDAITSRTAAFVRRPSYDQTKPRFPGFGVLGSRSRRASRS
jgi:uncharacterized protein (DUF302 family)